MSGNIDAGYFVVELEKFQVAYNDAIEESPEFQVGLELINGNEDIVRWSSNSTTLSSTPIVSGFLEPKEEPSPEGEEGVEEEKDKEEVFVGSVCTVGCNHFQRTEFIDLTDDNINIFLNSSLRVSISAKGKEVESKKGTPEPTDVVLANIHFPLSCLIQGNQTYVECSSTLEELVKVQPQGNFHETLNAALSSLVVRLSLDNGFAEYIAGGNVLQWNDALVKNIPNSWRIPLADTSGKKAPPKKGAAPSSDEEMRNASMELIEAALVKQSELATYSMTLSLESTDSNSTSLLPALSLSNGQLRFDTEAAASAPVSEEEPLENNSSLWFLTWESSNLTFIHRSNGKHLSNFIINGEIDFAVEINKSTPDGSVELTASGHINGSSLATPHETRFCFEFSAEGPEDLNAESSVKLTTDMPLVIPNVFADTVMSPVDVVSLKSVTAGGAGSRDVKKELRQEIADIVKEISQEYVGLYPQPPPKPLTSQTGLTVAAPGLEDVTVEARKAHFMHYLSTHGIYHRFKEALKPRIQRYARERYGSRNRAMGRAGPYVDEAGYSDPSKVPLDDMISELYVLLTRECNAVLNEMYKNTIIDRDAQELEKLPLIDDEAETPKQKFMRLLELAHDAAADTNHFRCEQFHLERIQMVSHEVTLKSDTMAPHHAYFRYYDYLIRRSASELMAYRNSESYANLADTDKVALPPHVESLRDKARQALESSNKMRGNDWMTLMQMGVLLLEIGQLERAGECLKSSVQCQLNATDSQKQKDLNLEEFQGYESDQICPVNPLTYIALSLYYTKSESALKARKAVRMAVRSFAEGAHYPPVSEHGKPRKTAVLCMAQAAVFMYDRGYTQLGDMCTQFSIDCDDAVNRKATERNLSFDTVPFISHFFKLAKTYQFIFQGMTAEAMKSVDDCVAVSNSLEHTVKGCMAAVEIVRYAFRDNVIEEKLSWYNRALDLINSEEEEGRDYELIPLCGYVEVGKVFIQQNRFEEALNAMLYGCIVYPSSTLFNLVGICCIRLERLQDAEDALQEANLIDNRNPNVWAYLCILCLHGDSKRMAEAEKSLEQALRLGLTNGAVLREMATSYIAVDKLQTAEDLIRRAMADDEAGGKSNPHSRRLLGDVLAGQNNAAQAVEEYQAVIEDSTADKDARIMAGENCVQLLQSLGRTEEKRTVEEILEALETSDE